MSRGTNAMEMQIIDEHIDDEKLREMLDVARGIDVRSVHSHLRGSDSVLIESAVDAFRVRQAVRLAEEHAQSCGHDVALVVHVGHSVDELRMLGVLDRTIDGMRRLTEEFGDVRLSLENITSVCPRHGGYPDMSNSYRLGDDLRWHASCADVAREAHGDRVGVTLDTCHLSIGERQMHPLMAMCGRTDERVASLVDDILSDVSPLLTVVHLAGARGSGFGRCNHGIPLPAEDPYLARAMRAIADAPDRGYVLPVVFETYERDMGRARNMQSAYEAFMSLVAQTGIDCTGPAEN